MRGSRIPIALAALATLVVVPAAAAQTSFMYLRGQSIHPAYEGWMPNDDGTFDLYFGYMNSNWEEEFDLPVGPANYFSIVEAGSLDDTNRDAFTRGDADKGQATHFYPRRNPFLYTVRVPADFGEKELVWTLTTYGRINRAYGSLKPDYRIDPQVISTEVGGDFGSLDDRLRANIAPTIEVEDGLRRTARVGEPMTLAAISRDADNYPPRGRSRMPTTPEELYRTSGVGSVVASGAPGMRFAWTVFRGAAKDVSFSPEQLKAWMDTRAFGNSPWSPPYVLPELPPDDRYVTEVTFAQPGEYILRAVASDGSHFNYENVTVTVTR